MSHAALLWTIDALGVQVALALAVDYDGAPNGRVRGVPDQRTIRYYTTLGLLDRPAEMRGRTALYNRRHLLQLVAIKRLQAQGLPLADVQHRLLGLTDTSLEQLAQLPAAGRAHGDAETPRQELATPSVSFWKSEPAPAETVKEEAVSPSLLQGVPLADGITLLLATGRLLDNDDIQAIRTVAAPLLKLLDKRRLRPHAEKGPRDDSAAVDPK